MKKLRRMQILQRTEELVHDVSLVDVLQNVGSENSMQIRFHILKHQIDILLIFGLGHVQQPG